jgi:hypothetical protein
MLKQSLGFVSSLCMVAALSGAAVTAVAAPPAKPAAPAATQAQGQGQAPAAGSAKLALLDGKLPFTLKDYEPRPMPGGGPGTMFFSGDDKRIIVVGEDPFPEPAKNFSDKDFLENMKGIKERQQANSPDYKVVSEKTERVKGLNVHHIEATDSMGGNPVLQATLLAAANKKFTVIQVISGADDAAGHAAAVSNILGK